MITNIPDLIFICGFMGAGKSTLGKKLAKQLRRPFLDLDDKIEEQAGQTIPAIFGQSGETGFRTAERRALMEIVRDFEGVVALGGGSLQDQHLVDHLKLNGLLIFIKTPISVILDRISGDTNRPLLTDGEGNSKDEQTLREELTQLYNEREPRYAQSVVTVADDGSQSPGILVKELRKKIRNHVKY